MRLLSIDAMNWSVESSSWMLGGMSSSLSKEGVGAAVSADCAKAWAKPVVVAAAGADDPRVEQDILEAVQALLQIEVHKIKVLKLKEGEGLY